MALNLAVTNDTTEHLNQPAEAQTIAALKRYADDLLAEASRLEAVLKTTSGNPEITSSMIKDADLLLRRGYRKPRKSRRLIGSQIIAPVSGFLTGMLADLKLLAEPQWLVAFVIVLTVTITSTVIVVLKE